MKTFIEFREYKIAYSHILSTNTQTAIVMLHEGLGSISQWRDLPMELNRATGLSIIIYERPGYGESSPKNMDYSFSYLDKEADYILPSFLSHFTYKNYILFGHSDGASIALFYAAKYPKKIKAIIAIAPHIFVENKTVKSIQKIDIKKEILIKKLGKFHGAHASEVYNRWASIWTDKEFKNWKAHSLIKTLYKPTLLIQSQDDEYASFEQLNQIHNQHKGVCHELRLDSEGHSPHFSHKKIILEAIDTFISACF